MKIALALAFLWVATASASTFSVSGTDANSWRRILGCIGITEVSSGDGEIVVAGKGATRDVAALAENRVVIIEGLGPNSDKLGIISKPEMMTMRQISDVHAPKMQIIWEQAAKLHQVNLPNDYKIFSQERWKGSPLLAGKRTSHGAILWVAAEPGPSGIERYPYVLQALQDLGVNPALQTAGLWAFFDSAYRIRADPDYLARRWRQAGVAVLHVAAWHNMESDPKQDEYLKSLIEACHRHAILTYAWLELPHVSEQFWIDHPAWREKTAVDQDAQLDWRKLMNLQNPECHREVERQVSALLQRFDWDGVNVAELYFESLEGSANPARFTPMNADVRADFQQTGGFDPKLLFDRDSPYSSTKNPQGLRKFLDYRAGLATKMQADWLAVVDQSRRTKPYLDVVLTHIDDRFEPGIRDELGADVKTSLPLMQARRSTLLVEDPATLWDLGAERYAKLAGKYKELNLRGAKLAVDINVVERYQDVYPTKKQTGVELFELVHQAAVSFGRVALYFESSLEKQDLALLPMAGTTATARATAEGEMEIVAAEPTRVAWHGPAELDGKLWPVQNSDFLLAPAGRHQLRPGVARSPLVLTDFNGEIRSAMTNNKQVDVAYTSRSRAVAILESPVLSIEVDGAPLQRQDPGDKHCVMLPAGQHVVTFIR